MENIKGEMLPMGTALVDSVLGYAVVFIGLALLMVVIILMGKIMVSRSQKAADKAVSKLSNTKSPEEYERAQSGVKSAEPAKPLAPGSAGEVRIYDTDPRDAAMIMAIVANKLGKPLNELRFVSIKEVKEQ